MASTRLLSSLAMLIPILVASVGCSMRSLDDLAPRGTPAPDSGVTDDGTAVTIEDSPAEDVDDGQAQDGGGCPDNDMVRIDVSPTEHFCIDALEVSQRAYQRFLTDTAGLVESPIRDQCLGDDHVPQQWDGCPTSIDADSPLPITCVDVCDAMAYCAYRNKRLCSTAAAGQIDEWSVACFDGIREKSFPYGSAYNPGRCNLDSQGLTATGAMPECRTPSGVFDLSGNAAEWTLGCVAGRCPVRGGSFMQGAEHGRCNPPAVGGNFYLHYDRGFPWVSFRCCL